MQEQNPKMKQEIDLMKKEKTQYISEIQNARAKVKERGGKGERVSQRLQGTDEGDNPTQEIVHQVGSPICTAARGGEGKFPEGGANPTDFCH